MLPFTDPSPLGFMVGAVTESRLLCQDMWPFLFWALANSFPHSLQANFPTGAGWENTELTGVDEDDTVDATVAVEDDEDKAGVGTVAVDEAGDEVVVGKEDDAGVGTVSVEAAEDEDASAAEIIRVMNETEKSNVTTNANVFQTCVNRLIFFLVKWIIRLSFITISN